MNEEIVIDDIDHDQKLDMILPGIQPDLKLPCASNPDIDRKLPSRSGPVISLVPYHTDAPQIQTTIHVILTYHKINGNFKPKLVWKCMSFQGVGNEAKRYEDTMDLVYLCASFFDETCNRKCIEYLTNPSMDNDNELMTIAKFLERLVLQALAIMEGKSMIKDGRARILQSGSVFQHKKQRRNLPLAFCLEMIWRRIV